MVDLAGFRLYLVRQGRKKRTIEQYVTCLVRLVRECPALTKAELDQFFLHLIDTGRKTKYINHFIDALRVYTKYSPVSYIPEYFKEQPAIKATMSDEEIEQFLTLPPPTKTVHYPGREPFTKTWSKGYAEWTLFFSIMAYTGMRPGEVAHLTVDTVDFGRNLFILEDTKTTPRKVGIPRFLIPQLTQHIKNVQFYLFPSLSGGQKDGPVVDNVDWHYNFHQRIKRLGIKRKGLTPYSLRHSFITRQIEEDVSIFKVQKTVGHRQLSTTAQYVHLTTKDVIQVVDNDRLQRQYQTPGKILEKVREYILGLKLDPSQFAINITEKAVAVELKATS